MFTAETTLYINKCSSKEKWISKIADYTERDRDRGSGINDGMNLRK